jgi:hypothetical protein
VVIGGGHGRRLHQIMTGNGYNVQLLELPTYRASNIHLGQVKEGLAGLNISTNTIFIVQLFDFGLYWAQAEDGSLIPLCKGAGDTYHTHGELVMARKEMQWRLFQQFATEMGEFKHNKMVLLAPLPRHMEEACCDDTDHMPNRKADGFKKQLEDFVYSCRTNLKDQDEAQTN